MTDTHGQSHPVAGEGDAAGDLKGPSRLERWSRLPAARARTTLLVTMALCVLSAWLLSRVTVSGSINDMLGEDDAAAAALGRIAGEFERGEELLVLAGAGGSPEEAREELVGFAQRFEREMRSGSTSLFTHIRWHEETSIARFLRERVIPAGLYYLDDASFKEFVARLTPESMREQIARNESLLSTPGPAADAMSRVVLKDPLRLAEFMQGRLPGMAAWSSEVSISGAVESESSSPRPAISRNGRHLLIRIGGTRPVSDLEFSKGFTDAARAAMRVAISGAAPARNATGPEPSITASLAGGYAIAARSAEAIRADMVESTMSSGVVMLVFFIIAYRRLAAPMMMVVTTAIALLIAFGIHATFQVRLTPLTAVIGAMLAGMGVDYCIFHYSHYLPARARSSDAAAAAGRVGARLIWPLTAACLTSAMGFMAIAQSRVSMLRDFAVLGAIGLLVSLLASLTLLPALLRLTERIGRKGANAARPPHPPMRSLASFVSSRSAWCIGACVVVGVAAVMCIWTAPGGRVGFESNLDVMHPEPNEPLRVQRRVSSLYSGSEDSLFVHVRVRAEEDLLPVLHGVSAALASEGAMNAGVSGSLSAATLLPDPRRIEARREAIRGIDAAKVIADFRSEVLRSAFDPGAYGSYETFLSQLLTCTNPPTLAGIREDPALAAMMLPRSALREGTPVTESLVLANQSSPLNDRERRAQAVEGIRGVLSGIEGVTVTGMPVLGHDLEMQTRRDMPRFILAACIGNLIYLALFFRSVRDTALAMIPVAFGVVCLWGFMAAFGFRLNTANLIALPLLFGEGVDNGLFLVDAWRKSKKRGGPAFRDELAATIHGFLMTSATSVLAFGSLVTMSVPAVRSLGWCAAFGNLAAMCGALFLLAPILSRLRKQP